jgi:uncharacterized membrane protein
MDRRLVVFKDESDGKITSWKWDFGDGATSTEQNPVHQYLSDANRDADARAYSAFMRHLREADSRTSTRSS